MVHSCCFQYRFLKSTNCISQILQSTSGAPNKSGQFFQTVYSKRTVGGCGRREFGKCDRVEATASGQGVGTEENGSGDSKRGGGGRIVHGH